MRSSRGFADLFDLTGYTALVTGAARGLGRAIATALADAGAQIAALDVIDMSELESDISEAGGKCVSRTADLGGLSADSANDLVRWAEDATSNPATVLVNNAGVIRRGPALNTSVEDWNTVLAVNLTAPFLLSQAFAQYLRAKDSAGSIINMASVNSFQGGVEVPSYAASKHGILGVTRALANEWAPHGIRVNTIAPGYMSTDLTTAHRNDAERAAFMLKRIPMARWGTPEDLAGAAIFLASDASRYVTGTTISVDGGWLAR
ncbi:MULTISPECIES: SDR family oxidoreductase [unclassified Rhodococcus (in: high G+C Gram-positive bacteria)]|uniref:SDR family oxidoreductase n=1 Tax=unclassified Rhodococcus (in: high G+C Gram-positive bacteria) TaxID=192944 RepID=UPI001C532F6F|nr:MULTISPECIES: SDR family oxidoreductase [unclassified Rhodococcus (in: high G+C Gram-positive bacteria)]